MKPYDKQIGRRTRVNWRSVGWLSACCFAIVVSLLIIRASLDELQSPPNPARLEAVPAEVIESRVEARMVTSTDSRGHTRQARRHFAIVRYRYKVETNQFISASIVRHDPSSSEAWARGVVGRYPVGMQVTAYYDRWHPMSAVLVPGYDWADWVATTIAFVPLTITCSLFVGIGLDMFRRGPTTGAVVHVLTRNDSIEFGLRWTPTFAWGGGVCAASIALGSIALTVSIVGSGLSPEAFRLSVAVLVGISILLGAAAAVTARRLQAGSSKSLRLHRDTGTLHVSGPLQKDGAALLIPTRLIRSIHIASEWFRLDKRQICESRTMVEWEEAGKRCAATAGLFHSFRSAEELATWFVQELGVPRVEDQISAARDGLVSPLPIEPAETASTGPSHTV